MKLLFIMRMQYSSMTKEVLEAAADILLDSLSDFHYDRRRKHVGVEYCALFKL